MEQQDADVIVVGAGHNGLICGAYLARSGIETLILEARDEVGGTAATVNDLGAKFNICSCDHTMIRALPIMEELELASHGLRYLEPAASTVNTYYDGSSPWAVFHDPEQTIDGISAVMADQAEPYRRYLKDALPVAQLVVEMARTYPTTMNMLSTVAKKRARGAATLLSWSRQSMVEVLGRYFTNWRMVMPLASVGPTVWGVSPETPGTGMAAVGYAMRNVVKTGRPEGGSGALTDAVRQAVEKAGGQVRCNSRVASLVIDDGQVRGVRLDDGTVLRSKVVVAATDPRRVMLDWVGEPPSSAKALIDRYRAQPDLDGYESKIDAVLTSHTKPLCFETLESIHPDVKLAESTTVVNPSPTELAEAHRLRAEGRVAPHPTLLVNTPTVLDPTMEPEPGHHILSLETLFTPYALRGGWGESSEPQRWLELWTELTEPGFGESIDRWRVMTPPRYEREFSMHRGHTPSFAGAPLSTLLGRPREASRYKAPINGLFFTGAGTYPGAGVFGAPGRNAASAIGRHLKT